MRRRVIEGRLKGVEGKGRRAPEPSDARQAAFLWANKRLTAPRPRGGGHPDGGMRLAAGRRKLQRRKDPVPS